ncbi:hypothetical protein [Streptomyces chattanoogensis]|uniref:hypothetical protein n=1 Tax=Streptomyces chattanoogensis TaxID=66876 RepID=UPI0036849C0F
MDIAAIAVSAFMSATRSAVMSNCVTEGRDGVEFLRCCPWHEWELQRFCVPVLLVACGASGAGCADCDAEGATAVAGDGDAAFGWVACDLPFALAAEGGEFACHVVSAVWWSQVPTEVDGEEPGSGADRLADGVG